MLFLALAVMPLQGFAASLSVLLCQGDAQLHAVHENGAHDHGTPHDGHHDEGGAAANGMFHLCCHITASAPPAVTLPSAPPDFAVHAFAPDPLHDLYIPDRPQRPPLA